MSAAIPYVKFSDVVKNMIIFTELGSSVLGLDPILNDYLSDNSVALDEILTQDNLDALLKMLTGMVVGVNSDMNCYPVGFATTVCFDLSGNVIP